MRLKKFISVCLIGILSLGTVNCGVFADSAVAFIGKTSYDSLSDALGSAKSGDIIELSAGSHEFGKVILPPELLNVTIKGAKDKATVIKNSVLTSSTEDKLNYTDITIDGIVFDNSYIALKSSGSGNSVYKNWKVTNCEFKNILTPDKNRPAFEYAQKAVLEKMNGFTFTNNVIENVSGGLNTGVRIGSASGKITISDNTIKDVSWNAIQITNVNETSINDLEDDPVVEITGNTISGAGADEGMVNLGNTTKCRVVFKGNTLTKRIASQPYLCYVKTNVEISDNTWLDENGNALDDETALEGVFTEEENAELTKAVERLKSFGIAKGISDKDFGAKEKVTREQMSAFIYRMMNKGESLENGENKTSFSDLNDPIFYGMVSWASEKGIIKGISETEFNPKGGITLQDAFAMVLRALGYEENEEITYPDGYINLAEKLRLSENVSAKEHSEELTRGDVAIILYNALFAKQKNGENVAMSVYGRHFLDGKKVLFIGNSWTFHGHAVFRKSRTVLELSTRRNDTGYFYQLAKSNGAEPAITNWTWGGHKLKDIFSNVCTAERECKGLDHLSNFTDYDYDYVFMQEGTVQNADTVKEVAEKFKAVNPDSKFFVLMPSYHYFGEKDTTEYIKNLEAQDITVVDWGRMVVDVANGKAEVPGAVEKYNKNSFIVALSETDGHHPNILTGYVTALMAYCALTGESAVGQSYEFCGDTNISKEFDFEAYERDYYVYDNATTNFPEIFASPSDMKGLQMLADEYLAK